MFQTQTSVWVCKGEQRGEGGRERERELCSFSWLRVASENFPSSPPLPAPTACLHYSRVFQATPMTARNKWLVDTDWSTSACAVRVHDGRRPTSLTVGTVCGGLHVHALFVHGAGSGRGGWSRRTSTVRSSVLSEGGR